MIGEALWLAKPDPFRQPDAQGQCGHVIDKTVETMTLPPEFLDELRARTPIESLIGRTVKLSKSGKNWKGCCPFHPEKTLSFYVYEDGYHCFGCGAHGDVIDYVMKTANCGLIAAVETLAKQANIVMPKKEPERLSVPMVDQSPGQTWAIENQSSYSDGQIEAVLAVAARQLVRNTQIEAVSILVNAGCRLEHWEHDNWNGGQETWRLSLSIAADAYFNLEAREDREKEITHALVIPMEALSASDKMFARIIPSLTEDYDWRRKVKGQITGEGITNQGRGRSDGIATIEHDGLLFRSSPEVYFYKALKRSGVPFAPLSVVLHGGASFRRIEPDFIVYKEGLVMIVEVDADNYHSETPAAAHARLKFLMDEGVNLERINVNACDTSQKAIEAVNGILATMEKLRRSR